MSEYDSRRHALGDFLPLNQQQRRVKDYLVADEQRVAELETTEAEASARAKMLKDGVCLLQETIRQQQQRVAELEAIVEKLRTTADGVHVGPDKTVLYIHPKSGVFCEWPGECTLHASVSLDCYSTREAAEAAGGK